MYDVRNDVISHAVLKNPWFCPVGFQTERARWKLKHWYTLEYLQENRRIRCAIDGRVMIEWYDHGDTNNGPELITGGVCIRVMRRSKMLFRNLEVRTFSLLD